MLTTDNLVRIAAAGGGIILDCGTMTTDSLVRIAAAAANSGSKIILTNLGKKTTDNLVRIAAAGKGNVVLDVR